MLVQNLLRDTAARSPEATALVCGDVRLTYADVDEQSDRVAAGLQERGVRQGDRVVVLLDNSVACVLSIFGILKVGGVFTVLNASTKAAKVAYVLHEEAAVALLTSSAGLVGRTATALEADARPRIVIETAAQWDTLLHCSARLHPVHCSTDDLACVIWTSGTSGTPKGVMSHHADMAFATASIASYLGNTRDDVIFCSLSLGFSYGLYQLLTAVSVGATLVLERGFSFPHAALSVMQRERVTGLPGVPTMFSLLLGLDSLSGYDLSSLRYLTNAAAPMPVRQVLDLVDAFPGVSFFSMYGQTECKRICYLPPEQVTVRPDSVGIPIPGTDAFVADTRGRRLPPGQVGELLVRGPHIMTGYWRQPRETALRLRHGITTGEVTLHTGDLFRVDEEGFLYFVSRADDIIKSRGEKISPAEVEAVIRQLPGVADVAAVGVPDPVLGEAVKVCVVRTAGSVLTSRELRAFCSRHLEDYMVPAQVEFMDELPRGENGKTLRRKLRICAA